MKAGGGEGGSSSAHSTTCSPEEVPRTVFALPERTNVVPLKPEHDSSGAVTHPAAPAPCRCGLAAARVGRDGIYSWWKQLWSGSRGAATLARLSRKESSLHARMSQWCESPGSLTFLLAGNLCALPLG